MSGQHSPATLQPRLRDNSWTKLLRIGDIVLLSYKTKSQAGSYMLGVVELEEDGLVHTVRVTYSLLRKLPKVERVEFKGITKKTIHVPVQRLVLIVRIFFE